MAQKLRTLVLPVDPGLIPSTYMAAHSQIFITLVLGGSDDLF